MDIRKRIVTLVAPLVLLALGACATPFRADVARFQVMPPPQGQSFAVVPLDPALDGSLEFSSYAQLVSQKLVAHGYQPAASVKDATLLVKLDYGVDNGREKIRTSPGFGGWGGWGHPWGWGGWGGWRHPYWGGWGWDYPEVESYTVFNSYLDLEISRAADSQRLFEGHAKAQTRGDDLTRLVPNLVDAMFTNFPGRSGETVRIEVPPPPRG